MPYIFLLCPHHTSHHTVTVATMTVLLLTATYCLLSSPLLLRCPTFFFQCPNCLMLPDLCQQFMYYSLSFSLLAVALPLLSSSLSYSAFSLSLSWFLHYYYLSSLFSLSHCLVLLLHCSTYHHPSQNVLFISLVVVFTVIFNHALLIHHSQPILIVIVHPYRRSL